MWGLVGAHFWEALNLARQTILVWAGSVTALGTAPKAQLATARRRVMTIGKRPSPEELERRKRERAGDAKLIVSAEDLRDIVADGTAANQKPAANKAVRWTAVPAEAAKPAADEQNGSGGGRTMKAIKPNHRGSGVSGP